MAVLNLPKPLVNLIKKNRNLYAFARGTRFKLGSILGSRNVQGIRGPVHYNDFMLNSQDEEGIADYLQGGRNVSGYIEEQLKAAGRDWKDVEAAFDIGCGYGRISRVVVEKMTNGQLHACDVIDDAVNFVCGSFDAKKEAVHGDPAFPSTSKFDLAWLYSVFTHLPNEKIGEMIRDISKCLKPNGLLIFTTQGYPSAEHAMQGYAEPWPKRQQQVLSAMKDVGYYYERYPYYKEEIGMTWHTDENIKALVKKYAQELKLQDFRSPGVPGGHQDYYTFIKQ
tara:strand:- start:1124 stop:1963 length:840 start_codon:yes stop_codon:yes gene_type:complete